VTLARLTYYLSRTLDPGWILEQRTLSRFLGGPRKGILLDVACREGFKSEFFAKRGFRVIGVDIDEGSIARARAVFGGSGCDFVIASVDQLPFRAGAFGSTSCLHALTMFPSPAAGLKEIHRVTGDDGELFLTVASVLAPWRNMRKYSRETLDEALKEAGFRMVDDCSFVRSPILRWIERLRLSWKPAWYRLAKLPLYLLSSPFALLEKSGRGDGYILGARARKARG
jgi:SAM-dependent methyltransferase